MSSSGRALVLASWILVAVTPGCGGRAYEAGAAPPKTPAEKGSTGPRAPPAEPLAAPAPPPPASAPGASGTSGTRAATMRQARGDFESARRELDVAASDCGAACRALGSMDRAAGHLCDLAGEVDEGQRCEEAKTKLYAARDRVRTTCGSCPGGASVERSAKVPSLP